MDKVEGLVDRARPLAIHQPSNATAPESFHSAVDTHLQKIHQSVSASNSKLGLFLEKFQQESPEANAGSHASQDPLSLDAFRTYMKDANASAQAPDHDLDISAPISDYFVSSSHNTYLTGNQLYSDAAASAYTSVLLRGCRSVEIDVWDGESETPDSSEAEGKSGSSSDSSDDDKALGTRIKEKVRSKTDSQEGSARGLPRSVSSKWGNVLRRKSTKAAQVGGEDASTSQMPIIGEPRVLHGHTLTKGASFREICYAIRDSAFVASDLPIIVSFEVHASLEQQQMMVDIIKEAWSGLLVEIPPDVEPGNKLPTLAELKRKILIKTKSIPLTDANEKAEQGFQASKEGVETAGGQPSKPSKILEALAKLAVYTRAYHFSRFDQPEAKVPVHIFSLSEKAARDAHLNQREALFSHNRSGLMRIYPFAFRVTSSNLDPSFYWRRGAQLVAMNWQNLDKGMMLNHGMFIGTPGWKLKPAGYRSAEPSSDVIHRQTVTLTLEVFAAQDLSLPPGGRSEKGFHPYVNCQLHVEEPESEDATGQDDANSEAEKSSYRRCTKSYSGRNPDFEGQKLVFPAVTGIVEELSFLRFKIKDDEIGRDSLAAWACIRLDRLRNGYRLVHLHDCSGEKTGGVLLVHITKEVS